LELSDFDFELPETAIARHPADRRDASRLLVLRRQTEEIEHASFADLPRLLRPRDLVVVNDTKVLHARLDAVKETGGKVEILLVEPQGDSWKAMVNTSKPLKPEQVLRLVRAPEVAIRVRERLEGGFCLLDLPGDATQLANRWGDVPLPPYLGRTAQESDKERYQTIFAREGAERSVAAPTAGLHFTREVMKSLAQRGVEWTKVTLHVGPGTFLPVRERIEDHVMHAERYEIDAVAADMISRTRAGGGRIVAVGTTVTRVLETVGRNIVATSGSTDLFIKPGFEFRAVDVLLTNFHLPKSTLLMLVAAYAGYDFTMRAYREAVAGGYRFFSYGDAMLIL
jgi:S-adenosylmethionine:tRNA ribosyltransferase-isomerase